MNTHRVQPFRALHSTRRRRACSTRLARPPALGALLPVETAASCGPRGWRLHLWRCENIVVPGIGIAQFGEFRMENPIKWMMVARVATFVVFPPSKSDFWRQKKWWLTKNGIDHGHIFCPNGLMTVPQIWVNLILSLTMAHVGERVVCKEWVSTINHC